MSVLRYYDCLPYVFRILGYLVCNFNLISVWCLVLCCDIYRSTLISIMYPACMITVHDRKSRALHKWPLDVRSLGHRDAIARDSVTWHTLLYDRARPRPRLRDRAGVSLCKCYNSIVSMVEATCL